MSHLNAVLTGDFLASQERSDAALSEALNTLQDAAKIVAHWQTPSEDTRFTRHRGDGWQIYLNNGPLALRAALYLQAKLIGADTHWQSRVAIGTDQDAPTPPDDLNTGHGPMFTRSGRALDHMPKSRHLVWADQPLADAVTRLADQIARGWTPAQARAVAPLLAPTRPARKQVAKTLGITRQAVDQAVHAAGLPALLDALNSLEEALT